jgi:(E)-4-hydroxy-3-methylbut-2-enyl-diphosphate synthase
MLPNGLRGIYPYATWRFLTERHLQYPLFDFATWNARTEQHDTLNFVEVDPDSNLQNMDFTQMVLVLSESKGFSVRTARDFVFRCIEQNIQVPVVYRTTIEAEAGKNLTDEATFQLSAACTFGPLLIDGLLDGIWIEKADDLANRTAFGILQAARLRITKTEYISCPSCGRTLFDLMETTAMIRQRTEHLKGIKIGIMGCIVNGPGEMADADYGYVGSGPGIITLYRGKEVVEKAVKTEEAVDKLLELIKEDGNWIEKSI